MYNNLDKKHKWMEGIGSIKKHGGLYEAAMADEQYKMEEASRAYEEAMILDDMHAVRRLP